MTYYKRKLPLNSRIKNFIVKSNTKNSPCSPQLEKARAQQQRPNTAKNKLKKKYIVNKVKLVY